MSELEAPEIVDDLPPNSALEMHIRVRQDDGTYIERWVSLDWLFNRIDTELAEEIAKLPPVGSTPARLG